MPGRFALREPYGGDVETRFYRRFPAAREAVVAATLLILRGAEADDALGISGKELAETVEFRPFVNMLRFAGEDNDDSGSTCASGPVTYRTALAGLSDISGRGENWPHSQNESVLFAVRR